jgi:hypothetical protein
MVETDFPGMFERLPLAELEPTLDIERVVPPNSREVVVGVSQFLHLCSAEAKSDFIAEFGPFLKGIDRNPKFFV